jgi:uncharacterized membrane protein
LSVEIVGIKIRCQPVTLYITMTALRKKIFPLLFLLLGLFFTGLMVQLTIPYFSFRYDVSFLLTKQAVLHMDAWRYSFYIHISTSIIVLLTGVFQFNKAILRKYPKTHRWLGRIYVFTLLGLSAPSGFIMALYANGGFWAKLSFVLISVFWWIFTFLAFRNALQRDLIAHRRNMYRSYALTLSAITLRLYVLFLPMLLPIHLYGKDMYVLVAWLSWIPNLLVAELISRKKTRRLKRYRNSF